MAGVTRPPVLRVTARKPQRYRAGFRFGPEPRVLTADEFGDDEIEVGRKVVAIATDRVLKVEVPVSVEGDTVDWSEITDDAVEAFIDRLALLEMDTLGAAGVSASSDAGVSNPVYTGGGDDDQPSSAAPSAPVAADQHVAATVQDDQQYAAMTAPATAQVDAAPEIPKPAAEHDPVPPAAPSGRKKTAKPAKAD